MKIIPIARFTVHGNSMLPTLKPSQDVLVLHWFYNLRVGDIVVIKKDGEEMIKRISKFLDRQNLIFVLGDNEKESTDSRNFGWINKKDIIGKVIWP